MTILQSLDRYHRRLAEAGQADDLGFTRENISYALSLNRDGTVLDVTDLRTVSGAKARPTRMSVPRPKRTSNIQANFLWDKTAYTFGVDAGKSKRLLEEHEAFRQYHRSMLSGIDDDHARVLLAFLDNWEPGRFLSAPFKAEMIDASFLFRLEDERQYLHEVPALRSRWLSTLDDADAPIGVCLVTGETGALETGHPVIKGVEGAQTAGAYLVAFNADAYSSYGKPNDALNAPTSKEAAARYGAALNRLLDRGSRNRLPRPVGDANLVFWADTSDAVSEQQAHAAEGFFALLSEPPDDVAEAAKLSDALDKLAKGRPLQDLPLGLAEGTRFHVLGLAPNAARLSVRYWLDDDFELFARRLARHYADLVVDPLPWGARPPSVQRLLVKTTALQEKFDNIPSGLAGEVMRAVLSGAPYPRTWLAAAVIRLRAGDDPGRGWHAAVIKACLNRAHRSLHPDAEELLPVSLDPDNKSAAYQLGRLFAVLESAQYAALGRVNATIADRYYGAASSTPARVFAALIRGAKIHISDARKRNQGHWIEPRLQDIIARLPPELPTSLRLEDQGRFAVGYYHERAFRPAKADEPEAELREPT